MASNRIFSPGVRKRKAYSTALRVFLSYFWLNLKSKIWGQKYYNQRITELHKKNADRIKNRIQELQGLFIKFGQLISNLSNVLPEEFRAPLEELQDHVSSKPYEEIQQTIKEQLGDDPENIFTSFNKVPLAAASIGQVHQAEINGQKVVVKIQHRNIERIAKADLTILKNLVKLHEYFMDMEGLSHTYDQVEQMIKEELNYSMEAQHMIRIRSNLQMEAATFKVKIPTVYNELSSSKVLTTEYFEGVNISQIEKFKQWGLDTEDISKRLIELYCKMILVDGDYHADPHPGNILINPAGEIILLDFGAVAHLSEATKTAIPELVEAVIRNDSEDIAQAFKKLGFVGSDKASKKYIKKLINIFRDFLEEEVELDGLNFQNIKLKSGLSSMASIIGKVDLREISKTIRIPKDYILLNRTIVLLMGNAFQLAPTLNIIDVVRPYMKKHGMQKEFGFSQMIVNTLKKQVTTAISLPNELSQFLKGSNESELDDEVKGIRINLRKIYFVGQQIALSLLLFIFIILKPQYFAHGWRLGVYRLFIVIFSVLLLRSIYKNFKTNLA